jgi:hypothetical protein
MTSSFGARRQRRPGTGRKTIGARAVTRAALAGGIAVTIALAGHAAQAQRPAQKEAASGAATAPAAAGLNLADAVIIGPASPNLHQQTALQVLVEEVEKRTQIHLPLQAGSGADAAAKPRIVVGTRDSLKARAGEIPGGLPSVNPPGAEGYVLRVDASRKPATVFVIGADDRGVLFGVGRLLREAHMGWRGHFSIAPDLQIATAPKTALRGHQLGYRPKTNSYDAFTAAMWDQYIRDLAIFGTNAIELIPPRSDDDADSPHFPKPQIEMMVEMSKSLDKYGLDVWIWYPAMDPDYTDPKQVESALKEWADVFQRLPRIDAVMVPGGDPGHTKPDAMFALLEKQTASLHKYHPKATMWLSPQGFSKEWMDEFYGLMEKQPKWLTGVVFGPQNRDDLPVFRKRTPAQYRIRRYPDITHTIRAEYGVQDWDVANMLTSEREPINPRPIDEAKIFRALDGIASDFITYSEGINDDVNKIVWSGLGWDRDTDVLEILRQYGRYFIGDQYADSFANGLLGLERNWRGPLLSNDNVYATLRQFQAMERDASPQTKLIWRFQQALYRAYFDAYSRARLVAETAQEDEAMQRLRDAKQVGSLAAMTGAEASLHEADVKKQAADWRIRVYSLAEALYQSTRMQLSVDKYQAIALGRGATLDHVETPVNDRLWLYSEFARIRQLADEPARLAEIQQILSWTDPGPGGFYDDLGFPGRQPHLVRPANYDPESGFRYASGTTGFGRRPNWRLSWMSHSESYYETPLVMKYTGLDPSAQYRVRVVYGGDFDSRGPQGKIRLTANDGIEIAPYVEKPLPVKPVEYAVPQAATRGGSLTLNFLPPPNMRGAGRGVQVSEVWLIRQGATQ